MIRSVMEVRESNAGVGSSLSEINLTWTNTGRCGIGGKEEELGACTIRVPECARWQAEGYIMWELRSSQGIGWQPLLLGGVCPQRALFAIPHRFFQLGEPEGVSFGARK